MPGPIHPRLSAAALLAALLLAGAHAWAAPLVGADRPQVHFFVEPLIEQGFGGTSYDLSADAGGGDTVLSRLEFPQVPLEAGVALGLTIDRGEKRAWLLEVEATHSTFATSASMNDYDWVQPAGYPQIPFSYTYSRDSTVSWHASVELAWAFASPGPWTFSLYGSYRYQNVSHVEDGATGWQYVWNGSAYDLYVIADPTLDVLEYSLILHTIGLGLVTDLRPARDFSIQVRACYTPVYESDRDDHRLRTKLSTSDGWGNGLYANLRAVYQWPGVRAGAGPYVALDAGVACFVVSTTQTQYWYGNADSTPQGTRLTGIDHVVTGTHYNVGLRIGLSL